MYIVWNPASDKPITKSVSTLRQATYIRASLKQKYPEQTFHIMVQVPQELYHCDEYGGQDVEVTFPAKTIDVDGISVQI